MRRIDTVVIGAGHAGLAMSFCLTDAARYHVVLTGDGWRRVGAARAGLAAPGDAQLDDAAAWLAVSGH